MTGVAVDAQTDRQTDVQTDATPSKAAVSHKLTGSLTITKYVYAFYVRFTVYITYLPPALHSPPPPDTLVEHIFSNFWRTKMDRTTQ